jgi:hypothetical protein
LMAIENLESGATSAILIPDDAIRPDWSDDVRRALSDTWLRGEDVCLVHWLFPRWWNSLSRRPDLRWIEFCNLLRLFCPGALLDRMPPPARSTACDSTREHHCGACRRNSTTNC